MRWTTDRTHPQHETIWSALAGVVGAGGIALIFGDGLVRGLGVAAIVTSAYIFLSFFIPLPLPELRRHVGVGLLDGSDLDISFGWFESRYILVTVTNSGPTLASAAIKLHFPNTIDRIMRMERRARPMPGGAVIPSAERLYADRDTKSKFWQEAGVRLPQGVVTEFHFLLVAMPPDDYRVRFEVIADELRGPRRAWWDFTITDHGVEPADSEGGES